MHASFKKLAWKQKCSHKCRLPTFFDTFDMNIPNVGPNAHFLLTDTKGKVVISVRLELLGPAFATRHPTATRSLSAGLNTKPTTSVATAMITGLSAVELSQVVVADLVLSSSRAVDS